MAQAGTFIWEDDNKFTCPDHGRAVWIYPDGFLVSYSISFSDGNGSVLKICGDQGVIDLANRLKLTYSGPARSSPASPRQGHTGRRRRPPDHFLDWLQCLGSRDPCKAPLEGGYQHCVTALTVVLAMNTRHRQIYAPEKREIRDASTVRRFHRVTPAEPTAPQTPRRLPVASHPFKLRVV